MTRHGLATAQHMRMPAGVLLNLECAVYVYPTAAHKHHLRLALCHSYSLLLGSFSRQPVAADA